MTSSRNGRNKKSPFIATDVWQDKERGENSGTYAFLCQQTDKINAYYNCYLIWIYLFLTHISDIASLYVFTHVMYILHTNNIFALMGVLVAYNKVDYLYGFTWIIRILAPLTDKTRTQMNADIVTILAPLTINPNYSEDSAVVKYSKIFCTNKFSPELCSA